MTTNKNGCFVNFSNHPLEAWTEAQKEAARQLSDGALVDLPFPLVSPQADEAAVNETAEQYVRQILAMQPAAVMCMGEFGVCFQAVQMLKQHGILCVYSCSERQASEEQTAAGTVKHSNFVFRRFRSY